MPRGRKKKEITSNTQTPPVKEGVIDAMGKAILIQRMSPGREEMFDPATVAIIWRLDEILREMRKKNE
jgi:hypothetical protein